MGKCHTMKKGQIYMCETCGLQLKVVSECNECCSHSDDPDEDHCDFYCCGESLTLKK
jgi:hypothetical protein